MPLDKLYTTRSEGVSEVLGENRIERVGLEIGIFGNMVEEPITLIFRF